MKPVINQNPNVAIILATYNGEKYIRILLSSLLTQINVNISIIIRDDSSNDNTLACIDEFQMTNANIEVLPSDDYAGGSAGRNFIALIRSLHADKYDYVALADQDDIWAPNKLCAAISKMRETKSDGYSSNLIAFDSGGERSWIVQKHGSETALDHLFQSASAGCTYVLTSNAVLVLQTVFGSCTQELPKSLSHDFAIYAICRSKGLSWYMDSEAHIFYRQHSANVFSAMPGIAGLWERFKLSKVGWYKENLIFVTKLLQDYEPARIIHGRLARFNMIDRFWLAIRCKNYRRKTRDQAFLAFTILFNLL
jgi:rhamnosyltransferase